MPSTTTTTNPPAEVIPRRVVNGALVGLGLLFVGLAAWRGGGTSIREPDARAVQQRELRFTDRADGGIEVRDAVTGQTLDVMQGEQGFLRGSLRGLARERKRRGLADASGISLQLIARADGRLTLVDAATGERIDLESFGPSNVAVYARWLGPTSVVR